MWCVVRVCVVCGVGGSEGKENKHHIGGVGSLVGEKRLARTCVRVAVE